MSIFGAFAYNLANLARFGGRQTRATFWPYVGLVVGLNIVGGMVVVIPMMVTTFTNMIEFVRTHPDQGQVVSSGGSVRVTVSGWHPDLMPDFSAIAGYSMVATAVTVLLLAAAVARRLHDTGRSGAWGALPVPFLMIGMVMMDVMMGRVTQFSPNAPDAFAIGPFMALFANNLVYIVTLVVLIVFTVSEGTRGVNAYGPPPA